MSQDGSEPSFYHRCLGLSGWKRSTHPDIGTVSFRRTLDKKVAGVSKPAVNGICLFEEAGLELTDCIAAVT